jgi:hypothetical protein
VIVGSACVKAIGGSEKPVETAKQFAAEFRSALRLISPLTHPRLTHRIALNMLKSARWFAYYYFYGFRGSVTVGGA